ncbi:MAG: methyltransferase domain-containing protein [Chloroflexi bacterium]|nr:methyltransferase domain-containing protein [Chloroflexota bacterium]
MPELMSALLFEKKQRALVAHRRMPPFAGQWMLPSTLVRDDEAAEDALRRHAHEQFGMTLAEGDESFVETVYLAESSHQYVANIFRAALPAGPLRFNAEGEYDDAKWLSAADLEQLSMPPDMRIPLAKILTDPRSLHTLDWERMSREVNAEAVPLAEREADVGAQPAAPATRAAPTPPPDNAAGWNTIAAAYQKERYGERFGDRLMWSWRVSEDDLHVLDDVAGKRALVLGCGGGQDVVALAKLGAVVTGIDRSEVQLAYARKYASGRTDNASFVEGGLEDLLRFDDDSFDLVVSIHALEYVEHAEAALAEAARVLKPGGVLAIAVKHPFDVHVDGGPPYRIVSPYWAAHGDWPWKFKDGTSAPFRHYFRTMSQWFELVTAAGFTIERVIEPCEADLPKAEGDELDERWMRLLPYTLIIKARKR